MPVVIVLLVGHSELCDDFLVEQRGELQGFVTTSLIQLLCWITKLG
jgi:hypothetical protein